MDAQPSFIPEVLNRYEIRQQGLARCHLRSGHDVIVPQFLGHVEFMVALQQLSEEVGARFAEVALVSSHSDVVAPFERRSATSTLPENVAAAELQRRVGGRPELTAMYDRMLVVIDERPQTHLIVSVEDNIDSTYAQLRTAVGETHRTV